MKIQDYKRQLTDDVLNYAAESVGYIDSLEDFNEACWIADSVTGNGSGSYTFNTWQAEENIKDLIFSEELLEMFQEFGFDRIPLEKGAEYIDVSIRCFLLGEVIAENEEEIKEILEIED
jgi:hypothetical protein